MKLPIISSYIFIFLVSIHTVKSSLSAMTYNHSRGVVRYPLEMSLHDPKNPGSLITLRMEDPPMSERRFDPSTIEYYISKKNRKPVKVNLGGLGASKDIYRDGKWYFGVHGWRGTYQDSPIMPALVAAIHNNENATIIHVDWEDGATSIYYPRTVENLEIAAEVTADKINKLVSDGLAKKENIHLIGFSLGGHLVGFIGKRLHAKYNWKPQRITGLDPAGPLFNGNSATSRLDSTDGIYVEVVHSSGGWLGYWEPIGHVDIYLNTGRSRQPGCGFWEDIAGSCSHQFAKHTYAKFTHKSLAPHKCKSFSAFTRGKCNPDLNVKCTLGFKYKECARGVYNLWTNNYRLKGARCATCFGSFTVVES